MATTQGPSSGNGEFFFGQTCGVEVQVPAGLPSLAPSDAPHVDAQGATSVVTSPVNAAYVGIKFCIPA